jgi:hypothetical protein
LGEVYAKLGRFDGALIVARQHGKIWELRAAMSMARLWRDQESRSLIDDAIPYRRAALDDPPAHGGYVVTGAANGNHHKAAIQFLD